MKPILLDFPERFETDRLVISIYDVGDGSVFFQILKSNYHHLQEEIREAHDIRSIEDAEEYVRFKRVEWITRNRLVPKIVEKATGKMVGQLWIEPRWNRMIFEIGYFIVEDYQGKGYITEAVKRMIEFLFNELQANKLVIHTKATNKKSIGIAERCGFTKEACIREGGRTNEGEIVDMLYFGLLKSEYGVSC
jgi:RimJ/RimL family protein N-acetyltransferase